MLFIFDLGNVVIQFDHNRAISYWKSKKIIDSADIISHFKIDKTYEAFEKGEIDSIEYWKHFCRLVQCQMSFDDFNMGWSHIFTGYMPTILKIIKKLTINHRVVVLTNTNKLHQNMWMHLYPEIFDLFHKLYISCEIGYRKPDQECYQYVLNQENHPPHQTVFFDDLEENIEHANTMGIKGVLVDGPTSVETFLKNKQFYQ